MPQASPSRQIELKLLVLTRGLTAALLGPGVASQRETPKENASQAKVQRTQPRRAVNEPQTRELHSNLGEKNSDLGAVTWQVRMATSTGSCETSS